jgi:hypothetical protein
MALRDDDGWPIGRVCNRAAKAFSGVFLLHLRNTTVRSKMCNLKARSGRRVRKPVYVSRWMICQFGLLAGVCCGRYEGPVWAGSGWADER